MCWLLPVNDEVEDCLFGGGGPVEDDPPPFEIVDIRLWLGCWCWWTIGRVSTSSLENDVLSLFRLELDARLQKEEKPEGTGLEAHPESMLDIEFLQLPFVGLLCSWEPGVDTVEALR